MKTFFYTFLFCCLLFDMAYSQVGQEEQFCKDNESNIILFDDFESYPVNTFPYIGNWTLQSGGTCTPCQHVTNSTSVSGNQSMEMLGSASRHARMEHLIDNSHDVIFIQSWMKEEPGGVDAGVFGLINPSEGGYGKSYGSISLGPDWKIRVWGTSESTMQVIANYIPGEWYKITLKLDYPNKVISVWVNDVLKLDNWYDPSISSAGYTSVYLGSSARPNSSYFDDIKVWFCDYQPEPETEPFAYYPFNGNANDESGNGNDGIVHGANLTTDRFGNPNSAYNFDGVDDYIELNNIFGGEKEISVSAWFNVAGYTGNFQGIFESEVGGGEPVVHLQVNNYGNNVVYVEQGGIVSALLMPILQPQPLNQWRHTVITSKSGQTRIYQNGVLMYQRNDPFDFITLNNNLRIGKGCCNGRYFKGKLDDIFVYNRALSREEVLELYNEGEEINKPPIAICKNISIHLDENGSATIEPSDIDDGSYDEDGEIVNIFIDKTSFNCSEIGRNEVTLTVTDNDGSSSTCNSVVNVIDILPPILNITLSHSNLWPPNHKMHTVTVDYEIIDNCAGTYLPILESITSNEPDNGLGDGDKPNDIQNADFGTSDFSFDLRQERSGKGNGRVYTITYSVADESGNTSFATAYVAVQHDMSKTGEYSFDELEEILTFENQGLYFKLTPNPVLENCNLSIISDFYSTVDIVIYNKLGQKVSFNTEIINEGENQIMLDTEALIPDLYILELIMGDNIIRKKFIKI